MNSINANMSATIAQNAMRRASQDLDTSMQRLSSGRRINSGSDDPAGMSMAARIESDALTDRQAARNANNAIAMLQNYSKTGRVIIDMLKEMRVLAHKALNSNNIHERIELDEQFWLLGNTWRAGAINTSWNGGVTRMNTFNDSFSVRFGGGDNGITMTFKSWDPMNRTAGQNITGATAIHADDANARVDWAWGFDRALLNLDTPPRRTRSHSHIQSKTAAQNAMQKLDRTISGAVEEVSRYGAYISRLENSVNTFLDVAAQKENGHSKIVNTNYALETAELTRAQIISQAATAVLAQANQTPQMLMDLLR